MTDDLIKGARVADPLSMSSIYFLLAQAARDTTTVSGEELKEGWGSLIFVGCFFLACIIVFIWWLSRR